MCDDNSSESDGIFGFYIAIFSSFLFFFFSFQSKRIIPRWRYGRVTRKAALFRPFRNPLSDFPSVWCAATPSPSLEHWVLSIFHAILSTPVSLAKRHHRQSSFPGCGSWICEIGKLSVSLLSLPLLRFTLSSFPPVFFFHPYGGTKGQSSSWEYSEEYVDTWRYIISSSFNFQFSAIDVDGEKNIALFVSEEFRRSIIRFRVEEVKRVIFISICEKVTRSYDHRVRIPISSGIRVRG